MSNKHVTKKQLPEPEKSAHSQQPKTALFDSPRNVKRVLQLLYVSCFLLFVIDFFIHRHISHDWESIWAFYPIYGFVSCVLLVIIASWIRPLIIRGEDYYDNEGSIESEKSAQEPRALKKGADHVDH